MALQEEFKTQGDFLFKNRSFLPLIILLIGLLVFTHAKYYGVDGLSAWFPQSWAFICFGVALFGLFIRMYTVAHTPKNTSGRNTGAGQIADEVNTTGIYSVVRHPLYVGNFFMWLGASMLTANTWFIIAFILFYYLYYERIMYAEENFLRKKFGDLYLNWANSLPAFVPSLKNFKSPSNSFSIKKVLKSEKNGLVAIFVIFWIFKLIGDFVQIGKPVLEYDFWFYGAVGTTILYLILKVMKRRGMFEETDR